MKQKQQEIIIGFGPYEYSQMRWIPTDYLEWVATRDADKFHHRIGGQSAITAAKQEIFRRQTDPNEQQTDESGRSFRMSDYAMVSTASIDDAVDLLMKEYLMRSDKSLKFSSWLRDLTREVIRNGEHLAFCSPPVPKGCVTFKYMKLNFHIERLSHELRQINR